MSVSPIAPPGDPAGPSAPAVLRQLIQDDGTHPLSTDPAAAAARQAQVQQENRAGQDIEGIRQAGVREQILASQDIHASQAMLVAQVVRAGRELDTIRTVDRDSAVQAVLQVPEDESVASGAEEPVPARRPRTLRDLLDVGPENPEDDETPVDVLL